MITHWRSLRGPLRFIESEDDYSTYEDPDGFEVYVQHGTGNVLVEFDDLDWHSLWMDVPETGQAFLDLLREMVTDPERVTIGICQGCGDPEDEDDLTYTSDYGHRCESCLQSFSFCNGCDEYATDGAWTTTDEWRCETCLDEDWTYCDGCDGYRRDDYYCGHGDEDGSCDRDCESPAQVFSIRNDGLEPLHEDRIVTVGLPAGTISEEGMIQIGNALTGHANKIDNEFSYVMEPEERQTWYSLKYRLSEVGDTWQTKQGNFTKRLSRFAYKELGLKLPPELISEIGNIAHAQSQGKDYQVAVTRDLNLGPGAFAHSGSCWWGSYSSSRCALKSNGGFALRSFDQYGSVTGRAWVMPLRNNRPTFEPSTTGLVPTFETLTPDAFVVFNGYGELSGYTPARIMAHMAGMTYRKVGFECDPMYVNNENGYLIAPEEIAEPYTDGGLCLDVDTHDDLYHREAAARALAEKEKEMVNV